VQVLRALLVLLLWLVLLCLTARAVGRCIRMGWRLTVLSAFTVCGVLVWLASELLSAFSQLALWGSAAFWIISALILWATGAAGSTSRHAEARHLSKIGLSSRLILPLLCSAVVIGILFLIAFVAAPNTYDSMTYHLSRVMHWQQNRSLRFFPTHIPRQLHAGPWAEMAVLYLQMLAGSDHLANLVQWFAMIGSVIGVSYIAKIMGDLGRRKR